MPGYWTFGITKRVFRTLRSYIITLKHIMDEDHTLHSAPPTYKETTAPTEYKWRIRNAKYRSDFAVHRKLDVDDYRMHLEYIKDSFLGYTHICAKPSN
jgi:hypothetical protein